MRGETMRFARYRVKKKKKKKKTKTRVPKVLHARDTAPSSAELEYYNARGSERLEEKYMCASVGESCTR